MRTLEAVALEYLRAGLTSIPVLLDGSKAPAVKSWRKFIESPPDEKEIEKMFCEDSAIGVLGGKTSGGLEIIDFDRADAFEPWRSLVADLLPMVLPYLPVVKTPHGYHVYLRSAAAAPNQKLAMEKGKDGKRVGDVIIETRGHGGYVLAPPSDGRAHPSGTGYVYAEGSAPITSTPVITAAEREILFNAARSFNEAVRDAEPTEIAHGTKPSGAGRPGDEFNEKSSWSEILKPHGWSDLRKVGAVTHWRRPGKDDQGISATTGHTGDKLYVFSSNASPFDAGTAYSKFRAFAILNHASNWAAAARELKDRGFGEQRPRKPSPEQWRDLSAGLGRINGEPMNDSPPLTDADAPPDMARPAAAEPTITADALDAMLDDDKAAAVLPEVFKRIMATKANRAEWVRIGEVLRRHKAKRSFDIAVKESEREKTLHHGGNGESWRAQLSYRENNKGDLILENILSNHALILQHDHAWAGVLGWDEFSAQIVTLRPPPFTRKSVRWTDADGLETKTWIEKNYAVRPSEQAIASAVLLASSRNSFNPLTQYLDSLEDGDGESLDTWLIDFFGAPDTPYVRAVGAKWLISAVARAYDPGCKVDNVLILEGVQGLRKSSVLEKLCPRLDWFRDNLSEFGGKQQSEEIEGKWIIEIGELKGFGRELDQLKAFVTRRAENYRPAYGRYVVHSPRKCVFAGTVNPSSVGYLRDETGNRRFWPVECTRQADDLTPALRDKLWAEARSRFRAGEKWWLEDVGLVAEATVEQATRVQLDPWQEIISDYLVGHSDTTTDELLKSALKIDVGRWSVADTMRVGRVLSMLGWQRARITLAGRRQYRFSSPHKPPQLSLIQ